MDSIDFVEDQSGDNELNKHVREAVHNHRDNRIQIIWIIMSCMYSHAANKDKIKDSIHITYYTYKLYITAIYEDHGKKTNHFDG